MTITYHKSHSFKDVKTGTEISVQTQLYQIGVYVIINNDASSQYGSTPTKMRNLEKRLKKEEEKGNIKDLVFGVPITVTKDKNGFYKKKDE